MDEKEIIEAARKAGVAKYGLGWTAWEGQLQRFARIIEAKTLERVEVKLLEIGALGDGTYMEAIRALGEKK